MVMAGPGVSVKFPPLRLSGSSCPPPSPPASGDLPGQQGGLSQGDPTPSSDPLKGPWDETALCFSCPGIGDSQGRPPTARLREQVSFRQPSPAWSHSSGSQGRPHLSLSFPGSRENCWSQARGRLVWGPPSPVAPGGPGFVCRSWKGVDFLSGPL